MKSIIFYDCHLIAELPKNFNYDNVSNSLFVCFVDLKTDVLQTFLQFITVSKFSNLLYMMCRVSMNISDHHFYYV